MTFDYLIEIGLGQMCMDVDDFWDITPGEFFYKLKGFFDFHEAKEKQEWRRTIELINIQLPVKDRINADAIFGDKKKPKPMPMEERLRRAKRVGKLKKGHGISISKFSIQK